MPVVKPGYRELTVKPKSSMRLDINAGHSYFPYQNNDILYSVCFYYCPLRLIRTHETSNAKYRNLIFTQYLPSSNGNHCYTPTSTTTEQRQMVGVSAVYHADK